jgi:hypothetical protein
MLRPLRRVGTSTRSGLPNSRHFWRGQRFRRMRIVLAAVVLLACAGPEAGDSPAASASPVPFASLRAATSPACAGLDFAVCKGKSECFWSVNTDPCRMGDPPDRCPPDQCVDRAPGPFDPRMVCVCAFGPEPPNSSGPYACVRESGHTETKCEPVPIGCTGTSVAGTAAETAAACACLSTAGRFCRAATDIAALCDCG